MLSLPPGTRIWLATEPCDMRKGFHSLVALVRQRLPELDPLSGQLFVFIGRNRRAVKILWWSSGGLSLYLKRLEQGTFRLPAPRPAAASLGHKTRKPPPSAMARLRLHPARPATAPKRR